MPRFKTILEHYMWINSTHVLPEECYSVYVRCEVDVKHGILHCFCYHSFQEQQQLQAPVVAWKFKRRILLSPINFFSQIPRKNCHNAMFYGIASSVFFGHIFLNAPLSHCCIMKIVYQREKLSAMFVLLFSTCTVISYMHGAN